MDAAQRMHCSLRLAGRTREKAAVLVLPQLLKIGCVTSVLDTSFQAFVSLLLKAKDNPECLLYNIKTHTQEKHTSVSKKAITGS